MSTTRILVVDDFEPFRRFICSTLQRKTELQIIGEASDGLEGVLKAEELQPDLIVLDIGLPTLTGIEAARRIRKLSPQSKILFVSQESSAEVVEEALRLGAGYVVKAHAAHELLAAVDVVLNGGRFTGKGLSGRPFTDASDSQAVDPLGRDQAFPPLTRSHEIEFYPDDAAFVTGFTCFIEDALKAGNSVIAVTTELHREGILEELHADGVDVIAAVERGTCLALDVDDTLSTFMGNDRPDSTRFLRVVGDLITTAARATGGDRSRVVICGECASILWAQGNADAAIQLEQLCNQLTRQYRMNILCGFSLSSFYREEDKQIFEKICSESAIAQ